VSDLHSDCCKSPVDGNGRGAHWCGECFQKVVPDRRFNVAEPDRWYVGRVSTCCWAPLYATSDSRPDFICDECGDDGRGGVRLSMGGDIRQGAIEKYAATVGRYLDGAVAVAREVIRLLTNEDTDE